MHHAAQAARHPGLVVGPDPALAFWASTPACLPDQSSTALGQSWNGSSYGRDDPSRSGKPLRCKRPQSDHIGLEQGHERDAEDHQQTTRDATETGGMLIEAKPAKMIRNDRDDGRCGNE